MGAALLRGWNAPALVTRVVVDAAARTAATAENTEVTGLAAAGDGLSWTQLDRALPLPVSFDDAKTDLAQKAGADLESLDRQPLVVAGLAPGRYELKVDGRTVGAFTEADLAKGVNLARLDTPMRSQGFSVVWSAESGHDLQHLRRRLLRLSEKDPSLRATADGLAAQDESEQRSRSDEARPKPREYRLVRLSAGTGSD
jgi:hypothetical protein